MKFARVYVLFFLFGFCAPSCAAKNDYFSAQDAETTARQSVIILDAGHGGTDEGAKVQSFKEKKITLLTTLLTKKHLEEKGYRVLLTRGRDIYVSLPKRVSLANKSVGTLFLSIHFNASVSKEAQGVEIFYYAGGDVRARASQRLANCVLRQVLEPTGALSRGVKRGNFHVIRETTVPAVLVEGGFMTCREEREKLKNRAYLDLLATGIAEGIDQYLRT